MPVFRCIPTEEARRLKRGGSDAYGLSPERTVSDGTGNPCRHCLHEIRQGAGMLVLAYRPFPEPQPYAETGPIFLCAEFCPPWQGSGLPPVLRSSATYLLRGYGADNRMVYGTGSMFAREHLQEQSARLLDRSEVAYLHVRSATYNCYQCRIDCQ